MVSAKPTTFPEFEFEMYPTETIWTLFEDVCRRCPQATAIDFELSKRVTYHELKAMVHVLVLKLRDLVTPRQFVPVLLPRSIHQVAVIIALARLDAVYTPLDLASPNARLRGIVDSTKAILVIAEDSMKDSFTQIFQTKVEVFDPRLCLEQPLVGDMTSMIIPPRRPDSGNLAAVLFTTGSTGQPKGVLLSHRNLIEPARLLARMEHIGVGSRIFQFAACAFDVHLIDILCALFTGATLCQVSSDNLTADLSNWVSKMKPNIAHLTPSVISLLEAEGTSTLQHLVTCGEPVTPTIIREWSGRVVLINLYGKPHLTKFCSVEGLKPCEQVHVRHHPS